MKIHVFGASGTGVTTLGLALSKRLDIPYFDSDAYFWRHSDPPFTIRRDPSERNALVKADLDASPNAILGGSILRWGKDAFPPFDLIVFLWLPADIRIARLRAREQARYGEKLQNDPVYIKHYQEFINWAADYDHDTGIATRTLNAHEKWLKDQTTPILQLREDLTVPQRLDRILAALSKTQPTRGLK